MSIQDSNRYALLVAVSHYEHEELTSLPNTLRDVLDMREVLVESYGFLEENVTILWDYPSHLVERDIARGQVNLSSFAADQRDQLVRASRGGNVALAVEDFLCDKSIDPDSMRLLYYGGHGLKSDAGKFYLALYESRPDKAAIGISGQSLKDWMEKGSKRQLVILDSCNAAGMVDGAKEISGSVLTSQHL